DEPAISTLYSDTDTEFILCAEDCLQHDLLQLRSMFEMYEYVVLPMRPIGGFLVAGNTEKKKKYQARVPSEREASESEALLRIKNVVSQATIALNNAVLKEDLKKRNQEVKNRNQELSEKLSVVNKVGQKLTSSIQKNLSAILELIYEQAGTVMDASNMFITLYDKQTRTLEFPLVSLKGKRLQKEQLPKARQLDKDGLTERVVHGKVSIRIDNVSKWCQENNMKLPLSPTPKSWLGVPMMLEGKLFGIIALFDLNRENAYNVYDREVLETMAGQAAVAIENVRLYESLKEERDGKKDEAEERTKELKIAQEDILEKESLLATSLVAQDVTHRLNNSLGALRIRIQQAIKNIDHYLENNDLSKLIYTKEKTLSNATGIVDTLLDEANLVANIEAQKISVKETASRLTRQILTRFRLQNKIILRISPGKDVIITVCYHNFNNCLQEMIENAASALAKQLDQTGLEGELFLKIEIERRDNMVLIDVIDNGIPIPTEIRPNIFENGFTTKSDSQHGYGLWRARGLAHTLGGELELLECATEIKLFRLSIPICQGDCKEENPNSNPLAFVIEDDPDWREIISGWLEDDGFDVETADTLDSALDLFNNSKRKPQLVLLDIALSRDKLNVDGLRLIKKAKKIADHVKIVILTAYKESATMYEKEVLLIIEKVKDKKPLSQEDFTEYLRKLDIQRKENN
ncbi:MAG: response regulator, partial [Candidatus Electrothrix sp. AR3]|nr:response regulator [Candidatus Electrothrix sp. AR3]